MFKAYDELPKSFVLRRHIDIENNKKERRIVMLSSLIVFIGMFVLLGFIGVSVVFRIEHMFLMIFSIFVYIFLHEGLHVIAFHLAKDVRVKYKWHGFAVSASVPNKYFDKRHYIIIGLAPLVVLSVALITALVLVSSPLWFIYCFVLLAFHLSGSVGDAYVVWVVLRQGEHVLVNDYGAGMKIYGI